MVPTPIDGTSKFPSLVESTPSLLVGETSCAKLCSEDFWDWVANRIGDVTKAVVEGRACDAIAVIRMEFFIVYDAFSPRCVKRCVCMFGTHTSRSGVMADDEVGMTHLGCLDVIS